MSVTMMASNTARPPYVQFQERSREDRAASEKEGRFVSVSVDYVVVRQIGSKDTFEKEATDWLKSLRNDPNILPEWAEHFHRQYNQWKSGQEVTPNGTHVKTWQLISRAESDMLINANLRTVEDLAAAPESALMAVGLGARVLQQKARAWLDTAKSTGTGAQELIALRTTTESQAQTIAELQETVRQLSEKIINSTGNKPAGKGKNKASEDEDFLGTQAA